MKNRLRMITRKDEELSVCPRKGLGRINMRRTKKSLSLLLRVINVGRSMLCARVETHRRGVPHLMEIIHEA
jgi:hypothetical protein